MAAPRQVAQQDRPSAVQARALIAELETKARESENPLSLATVLREEYAALTGTDGKALGDDLSTIINEIHGRHHAALCLSGGGIRSATFNLGVLQALAKRDLLQRFHYLSTVSGGGYIGSWLSSWIARGGIGNVCSCLALGRDASERRPLRTTDNEPQPLHHLRSFSRYLSPRVGLFSADTWTLAAAYIRNLLLTWVVLLPALAAMAAIPLIAVSTLRTVADMSKTVSPWPLAIIVLVGMALAVQAVRFVHRYRPHVADDPGAVDTNPIERPDQATFLIFCLAPFVLAGVALTTAWVWVTHLDAATIANAFATIPRWIPTYRFVDKDPNLRLAFFAPMAYLGALVHLVGWLLSGRAERGISMRTRIIEGVFSIPTGAVCGFALAALAWAACPWPNGLKDPAMYTALALPTFGVLLLLAGDLHLGFVSTLPRHADDGEREWAARFNGWVLIVVAAWIAFSTLTVIVPSHIGASTSSWIGWSSLGTYGLGAVASWLGFSAKTGSSSGTEGTGVSRALRSLSPSVLLFFATASFCLLLAVLLAEADAWTVRGIFCSIGNASPCPGNFSDIVLKSPPLLVAGVAAGLLAFAVFAGYEIDMNKFSLHGLYRMRLIRAYLGASRKQDERHEDPFIGFDPSDNIHMRDLRASMDGGDEPKGECEEQFHSHSSGRPLHIVNVALNLVHGARLAWQDRKAESFTISPLHAGNFRLGYRRTSPTPEQRALEAALAGVPGAHLSRRARDKHAPNYYGGRCGVSLGTAMAISGAAASPNMGYHSSAIVTFLMTLFNARLGWWLGNPGAAGGKVFQKSAPGVSLFTLWKELFGQTDDKQSYVYLSDGGHFDNLGLYEMIVRRCRLILVCDASADKECSLADLGNAMRQIRADMQIPIEFEDDKFRIQKRSIDGRIVDGAYWAKASIRYSAIDAPDGMSPVNAATQYDGTLIYVKPCFYGKEPRDVYNYAIQSKTFPHESTANQFFGESQFESYRALGEYIGGIVCREAELDQYMDRAVALPTGQGLRPARHP